MDNENGSGFEGIDRERAQRDIEGFGQATYDIYKKLENACTNFFSDLKNKWGSPKAVEYTLPYSHRLEELVSQLAIEAGHIYHGAYDAANVLLKAHGEEPFVDNYELFPDSLYTVSFEVCDTDVNGLTGMDKAGVKVILNTFTTIIHSVIEDLAALPTGISFYDSEGVLVETYDRNLFYLQREISMWTNTLITKINESIDEEIDNILLAKEEAQDIMQA